MSNEKVSLNYINFGDDDMGKGIRLTIAPEGIARLIAGCTDEHERSQMTITALQIAYEQGKRKQATGSGIPK